MNLLTINDEANSLNTRFNGVNRAEFARMFKIKGGGAYIYQHITGRRPLNLDAALAYAKGFNVSLGEISPRLANEVLAAIQTITPTSAPVLHHEIEATIKIMEGTDDNGKTLIRIKAEELAKLREPFLTDC